MSAPTYVDAAALDELPDKGFITRTVGEVEIVLCRLEGEVFAVENLCSHAFSRFDGGRLRGHRLMCPLHGACFDIRSGESFGPPAMRPIRSFPTHVEGGRVLVDLS